MHTICMRTQPPCPKVAFLQMFCQTLSSPCFADLMTHSFDESSALVAAACIAVSDDVSSRDAAFTCDHIVFQPGRRDVTQR